LVDLRLFLNSDYLQIAYAISAHSSKSGKFANILEEVSLSNPKAGAQFSGGRYVIRIRTLMFSNGHLTHVRWG